MRPVEREFALGLVLGIACIALPAAAAAPTLLGNASWVDNRHGWVECRPTSVCATEYGGRTWHDILSGGNYVFSAVRISAAAGVAQIGNLGGFSFWTRDNGMRCDKLPRVLWRSADGGATWLVAPTTHTGIRAAAARPGALGKRVAVPGGTVAPVPGGARTVRDQTARDPAPAAAGRRRCRVVTTVVAWPAILAAGGRPSGVSAIRWWSNDGGSSWSVFGRC